MRLHGNRLLRMEYVDFTHYLTAGPATDLACLIKELKIAKGVAGAGTCDFDFVFSHIYTAFFFLRCRNDRCTPGCVEIWYDYFHFICAVLA